MTPKEPLTCPKCGSDDAGRRFVEHLYGGGKGPCRDAWHNPKEPSLGEMLKHAAFICETYDADLVPNLRTTLAKRLEEIAMYHEDDGLSLASHCRILAREIRGDS